MQVVIAAAMAPAEPSAQDGQVAQIARAHLAQAHADLIAARSEGEPGAQSAQDPGGIKPVDDSAGNDATRTE